MTGSMMVLKIQSGFFVSLNNKNFNTLLPKSSEAQYRIQETDCSYILILSLTENN